MTGQGTNEELVVEVAEVATALGLLDSEVQKSTENTAKLSSDLQASNDRVTALEADMLKALVRCRSCRQHALVFGQPKCSTGCFLSDRTQVNCSLDCNRIPRIHSRISQTRASSFSSFNMFWTTIALQPQEAIAALNAPPVFAEPIVVGCKDDAKCAPTVESIGTDMRINTPGGRVTFRTDTCGETDLCDLAAQVKALLDKFSNQ
jgi:hypothetical protein